MAFSIAFSLLALFYLSVSFLLLPTSSSSCSPHTCQVNAPSLSDLSLSLSLIKCHTDWLVDPASQLSDACSSSEDCATGLYCGNCPASGKNQTSCTRSQAIQPTSIVSTFSLFLNSGLLSVKLGWWMEDFSSGSYFSLKPEWFGLQFGCEKSNFQLIGEAFIFLSWIIWTCQHYFWPEGPHDFCQFQVN